jgi:hypothetical protein
MDLRVSGWESPNVDFLFARHWLSEVELALVKIQNSQVVDGREGMRMGITQY